ncbi:type I polyketide synthase [Micromonospora sp. NBC_01699]|uniref:type I polyketide synthase n=1 Tax=Micromonospora sp. NBC_01699 TaxID=2975984 RepID=UPI002E2881A0|nr:type I polyketide synthase [Micromonospora sp. NBC_01699]
MSDLHERLANLPPKRLALLVLDLQKRLDAAKRSAPEPIAVVGVGCRFPGGVVGPGGLWELLVAGGEGVGVVPGDRWDVDEFFDGDPDVAGRMYTRWGHFVSGVDGFDAGFFGVSPREAVSLDPQQRLLLEVAWEALEHAGQVPARLVGSRTGVFVGIGTDDYSLMLRSADPATMDAYTGTGNAFSVAAGRLSYLLGLQGPSLAVDTACSSSLVAVHLACRSLRSGESNLALAGGVHLVLTPEGTIYLSRAKALSPDGRCKTFDASADGYGRGEGCGVVVLKRLSDARRDGDRVLAVIRGSAVNHDGPSSGLTVPNGLAQQELIRTALTDAGVTPADIDYVEAHGTGTSLGDPIEIDALAAALGEGRAPDRPVLVGSVKTNIGHLEAAAGIAGLIKLVLALQQETIPPHLHLRTPNPHIAWEKLPVEVTADGRPWPRNERPRIAGVSSFGMSGTNAHVIVAEAPAAEAPDIALTRDVHVLPLSARDDAALRVVAQRYADLLEGGASFGLVCAAAGVSRSHFPHRLAVVASDAAEAVTRLRGWLAGGEHRSITHGVVEAGRRPRIGWLFTGQGAQSVGMARGLYESEPVFRAELDRCAELLAGELDRPLLEVLFQGEGEAAQELLDQTGFTQPVLFAVEWALARLWRHWGVEPEVVAGHSVGELVAACVAGVFSLEDGLRLVAARGRLMQALPAGGAMLAVSLPVERVTSLLAGTDVVVAAVNSPVETVVAGPVDAVAVVGEKATADGVKTTALHVSHAFHSPLMASMVPAFRQVAEAVAFKSARRTVVSNVTGGVAGQEISMPGYWVDHVLAPVRFADGAVTVVGQGCTVVQEIGPHPVLLAAARQSVADDTGVAWVPSLRRNRDDWQQMMTAVATLYTRGVDLDWKSVTGGVSTASVDLPTYPFQRQRYWASVAPRQNANPPAEGGTHPLLGRNLTSPALASTVFETTLAPASHPLLTEHRIYDQIVVPGAHHLTMLAAATDSQGTATAIADVVFPQPMLLADGQARVVQVVIGTATDDGAPIQLVSRSTDDPTWTTHATATLRPADDESGTPHETPAVIQERCTADPDYVDWFYDSGWRDGLELDAGFRWQSRIWRRDGEALCRMRAVEDTDRQDRYVLHPGLIDASFQIVGATLPTAGREFAVYVPLGLDRFRLHRAHPADRPLWGHARLRPGSDPNDETLTADVRLIDDDGQVVAESRGLHLKRAERSALLRAGQSQATGLLHEIAWQPQPAASAPAEGPGRWLLCADRNGVGTAVAAALRARGHQVVVVHPGLSQEAVGEHTWQVDPADPTQVTSLLRTVAADRDVPFRGAVLLWGAIPADGEPELAGLDVAQARTLRAALHLLRGLAAVAGGTAARLHLVTRGAFPAGQATVAVAQTPLWGLGNVIELEHPELWGGQVDLDPAATDTEAAAALVGELLAPPTGDRIAVRGGERLAARLVPQRTVPAGDPAVTVAGDGTYLITGGLGALGLAVARWLVARGAGHLILVGRREPTGATETVLDDLRRAGAAVTVAQADVTRADDVTRLLTAIPADRPLRGVVHAAGVLDDGVLLQQPWENFVRVLAPKVAGGWNLHRATRDLPLDFFVLFSSAASLLGSTGQANYAAANAFLDGLAHHRRSLGLPAVSVNWGPWTEAGMAARAGQTEGRWAALGIGGITPEQGIEVLEQILHADPVQVGVLPVTWSTYLRRFPPGDEPALLRELARTARAGERRAAVATPGPRLAERLAAAAPQDRLDLLRQHVRGQVVAVLGLPATYHLEPRQKFFEIGLDSLMAIELKNTLQSQLGKPLPSTVVFEYPTVEALTTYLAQDVLVLDVSGPEKAEPEEPAARTDAMDRLKDLSENDLEDLLAKKLAALAERRSK